MKRRIKQIGIFALLGALVWYLFIKSYDYKVTFVTPNVAGTVYSNIIAWNNWDAKSKKTVTTISKIPFTNIVQEFSTHKDSTIIIEWDFKSLNDSTSKVTAYLTDKEHSFMQRLKVPFGKTPFVKKSISTLKKLREGLVDHSKKYKVSGISKSKTPEHECACSKIETTLPNKANEMIKYNAAILGYFLKHDIKYIGKPILEVTNWNKEANTMTYNFCFPIKSRRDSYPKERDIFIKTIPTKEALKATFNGNYRISDRGWFTILEYAKRENINLDYKPIEVFYNDPHNGGDELSWKAEVYLPIKNE